MANFRPVSNLSFLSQVIERVVTRQLNHAYLTKHGLLQRCQSEYRLHHSTEMSMLRVFLDALTAADNREVTLLACSISRQLLTVWTTQFATTIAAEFRSNRCRFTMADIVPEWPYTAADLRLSAVCNAAGVVWRSAWVCSRPSAFRHLYRCRQHPSLAECSSRRWDHCIVDVATRFSMNRLRVNPAKTQLTWLDRWGRNERSRKLTSSTCRSWRHQ